MVLGLGDSIMCGPDEGAFGVPPRAWPQWLAEVLDLPFHRVAAAGALTPWIASELAPRVRDGTTLACVHVGTNDVRSAGWDPDGFASALSEILAVCGRHAERTCVATVPLDLGRPRAGAKVADCDAIIRRAAAGAGAIVVGLDDLRGWRLLFPDAVHPTALGQLEIADRAAAALGLEVRPSAVAEPVRGVRADVRYGLGRQAAHLARDWRRRAAERRAWRARQAAR